MDRLLREYLQYGGYPRAILADSHEEKVAVINGIYRSYLERDIVYLLRVEKSEALTNLVRMLAAQSGKLVILTELTATLGLSMACCGVFSLRPTRAFTIGGPRIRPRWILWSAEATG